MATATKTTKKTKKTKNESTTAVSSGNKYGTTGNKGIDRTWDLPWNEKKVAVFKALKSLKAVGSGAARSIKEVAEKAGVTPRDVRHYVYHARVSGLTDVATVEGVAGHSVYLTKKGATVDPSKELKQQEEAKATTAAK